MALSQAANLVEKALGHQENAITEQNVSNPARDPARYADKSGATMKALIWNGKNSVKVVEAAKPGIVEDRDVILKVTGGTVCGSDLHLLHGTVLELQKGDILGHEGCGIIESVGSAVKNLKPGQRVVASFQIACGECMYCQQKLSSQCERTNSNTLEHGLYGAPTAMMLGYSHLTSGTAGTQAEYIRIPLGDINLLPLPDSVPDEAGLYLSDVLPTAWNCVVDTGVKDGDVVAVWGAGPIGQMAAEFAFYNGASRVILIDGGQGAWRLKFCQSKLPKLELLDFTNLSKGESITSQLKKMVQNGPDVALECVAGEYAKGWLHYLELLTGAETDTSELLNEMITSVKNYGRVGVTGVYVGFVSSLMERGIRLIGNGQAPVHLYWEHLLKLLEEGKIHPYHMLTHRVTIDDLEGVYEAFEKKSDGMQKVFVETQFSAPPASNTPSLTRFAS